LIRRAAEAFLLTTGVVALVMLVYAIVGVRWSPLAIAIGTIVVWALAAKWILAKREGLPARPAIRWWHALDLVTLVLIAGYARLALAGPPTDPDFSFIWGMKGRTFFIERGIDWAYLTSLQQDFTAHTDYPVLLPNLYAAAALFAGEWSDRWLGVFNILFGVAATFLVGDLLRSEVAAPWRAVATLMLVPLLFSPYFGIAEGPLVAFSIAGLLFVRRGETTRGAVYLGLAAFTKNEGVTLIVAVLLAMIIAGRWKELPRLWPAAAIAFPWMVLARMNGLTSDLFAGDVLPRLMERGMNPGPMLEIMRRHPSGSLAFWLGIAAALMFGWRRIFGAERFIAVAIAAQFLFFIGAYLVSPHDLGWHIRWSWERIVHQLMPAAVLLAILANRDQLRPPVPSPVHSNLGC